jgi:hypothetical protein
MYKYQYRKIYAISDPLFLFRFNVARTRIDDTRETSGLITHIHIDLKLANKNISKIDFCIIVYINYIAQYILFRSRVWISCRRVRA